MTPGEGARGTALRLAGEWEGRRSGEEVSVKIAVVAGWVEHGRTKRRWLPPSARRTVEGWVTPVSWAALAIFIAVPVFAWRAQHLAGRVVWTVVVAALPLFIVLVGYHRWRRICPLAFFAQLPARLGRPGARRASARLEENSYTLAFTVFFASLWLHLIATNGNGRAIALFFTLLSLAALVVGALFTGKTWCNFVCPDGWIQKVVGKEEAGGLIGEMAVLDPAPRSATVVAGADGTRVLRLNGDAFRHALNLEPAIADGVIRALAQRLRGSTVSP